jgi:hypothetical protein
VRRSRLDVSLGRLLTIGQTWRDRDTGVDWTVRQVHRADAQLELVGPGGARRPLRFAELRAGYALVERERLRVVA